MRRPNLLTPAGKRILRCLVAGEELRRGEDGSWFLRVPPSVHGVRVHLLAAMRLLEQGFIARDGERCHITALGHAALEERAS